MQSDLPCEADAIWDAWCTARTATPRISADEFADGYGERRLEALSQLETLLAVEEEAPLPSLVRVLRQGADGQLRFAGFRLLQELGEGAAGIVFEAVDERSGGSRAHVALKLLNPVLGSGSSRRDGILREALITQALDHSSIVRVLGSGTEQGYSWIATELIAGDLLSRWIDDPVSGSERVARALEVGVEIAAGLDHAHGRGVLHRDLKPSNVMIGRDGHAKLLDFGLARHEGAAFGVSRTGEIVGTPLYMAPEQLRGEADLDGRVDLYALGLVLLELSTGRRLLVREDGLQTLAGISGGERRIAGRCFAGLPGDLAGVLSRCLEPDRRDRYESAHALREDLEAVRGGSQPRLSRLGVPARLVNQVARRPVRCAAIAGLASLLVVGSAWLAEHIPISVTIDSISARPTQVWIDGEEVRSALPLTHSFWERGPHDVLFSDGRFRYPFTVEVHDGGARSLFLPFERIYRTPGVWLDPEHDLTGSEVSFLQVGVRSADHEDHHQSLRVRLETPQGTPRWVGGFSTLPLAVREEPHVLRVESEGFRSRDVTIRATDGRTRSLMLELDREESPWHTILIGSPLDPILDEGRTSMENLTLRWEKAQRDSFSDGFVHRIGLGVIEPEREGRLQFTVPLPCVVGELQILAFANPELIQATHPGQAILVEMGPSWDQLMPVLEWWDFPGVETGLEDVLSRRTQSRLSAMMRDAGASELHVRYRAVGAAAWILRTNALPRRTSDGGVHWEPALALRVRAPGSDPEAQAMLVGEMEVVRGRASRVIDVTSGRGIHCFDGTESGGLEEFQGRFVDARVAGGMDANGDGRDDFAVSLKARPNRVELRSGENGSTLYDVVGEPGDALGHSCVFVPDMDGDGAAELLVGAPQGSLSGSDGPGYIRLLSGKTGEAIEERAGERLHEGLGWSLDLIGDLDGRGNYAVISSTDERQAGGWGSAKVLSLPDLRVLKELRGREQSDWFGSMCSRAGDVNGDGKPDFLISAISEDAPLWDSGAVYVYSGDQAAGFPLLRRVSGDQAWAKLGGFVAPASDLDGDGHDEWLTGQAWGFTVLVSGKSGRAMRVFSGGAEWCTEGLAVPSLVMDLDGDGQRDIAVPRTEAQAHGSQVNTGVVYSVATGEALLEVRAARDGAKPSLAAAPDLDGDGVEDLFLGLGRREGEEGVNLLFSLSGTR